MIANRTKQKGLSLLELLIALAVFAIFITPMLTGLYAASVTAIGNAKERTLASYIAQNHLAELQLEDECLQRERTGRGRIRGARMALGTGSG